MVKKKQGMLPQGEIQQDSVETFRGSGKNTKPKVEILSKEENLLPSHVEVIWFMLQSINIIVFGG